MTRSPQKLEEHHQAPIMWLEDGMKLALHRRTGKGRLRQYGNRDEAAAPGSPSSANALDFASNDYLGLARLPEQHDRVEQQYRQLCTTAVGQPVLGSTGSRLLAGDSDYVRWLETQLAAYHSRPAALLFNSGYDANLSVLSCLPCRSFLYDEYAHNSLQMGLRWSRTATNRVAFGHNDLHDLELKLQQLQEKQPYSPSALHTVIVVESVYSMDGDVTPLDQLLDLACQYGALVVVDDAHGLGVLGDENGMGAIAHFGVANHPALGCSIHTFGKAAGCHGAVVCGSETLRQYLWNYAYPLIYSTSLPLHSLVAIQCAYETMQCETGRALRVHLRTMIQLFRHLVQRELLGQTKERGANNDIVTTQSLYLLPSTSPIQALVLPHHHTSTYDNNSDKACPRLCQLVWKHSSSTIRLFPIVYPTVPQGQERIRIVIHAHNTQEQVVALVNCLKISLIEMGLLPPGAQQTGPMAQPVSRL